MMMLDLISWTWFDDRMSMCFQMDVTTWLPQTMIAEVMIGTVLLVAVTVETDGTANGCKMRQPSIDEVLENRPNYEYVLWIGCNDVKR